AILIFFEAGFCGGLCPINRNLATHHWNLSPAIDEDISLKIPRSIHVHSSASTRRPTRLLKSSVTHSAVLPDRTSFTPIDFDGHGSVASIIFSTYLGSNTIR